MKGGGHFPEIESKGGDADVEKAFIRCAAFPDVFHRVGADTYHKSVLTARLVPERSTG